MSRVSHESEPADSTRQAAPGLGRASSGPAFAPPTSGLPLEDRPLTQPLPAAPPPARPPRQSLLLRIAPVVGAIVILAIGAVMIFAGAAAEDRKAVEDARRPIPSPTVSAPAVATDPAGEPDVIEFTTREGRGELSVIDHTWLRRPGSTEVRLRVLVEIRSIDGMIDYDPAYFFAARDLAAPVRAEDSFAHGDLDVGLLAPGEGARGYLTFLLPRGDITLMMSSNAADWVTAIKIVD